MNEEDSKRLFAEWREDYAARRREDGLEPPAQAAAGHAGESSPGETRQASGDQTDAGAEDASAAEFMAQLGRVRPVTRNLINAIMLDLWPDHGQGHGRGR